MGLCDLEKPLGDDTLRRIVSSKTRILGLCGLEKPLGDDTLRRIVSSKTAIMGLCDAENALGIVSSNSRVPRLTASKAFTTMT